MNPPVLRDADIDDIPALADLGRTSFVAKFGHLYDPVDLNTFLDTTFSDAVIAAELANPDRLYRIADIDGQLAAYCKLGLSCPFPEHAHGARTIELKQLYTDAGMTGRGLGAMLMDWTMAEAAARGADEIQLSVWSENTDAQRFYSRYGFARVADVHFWVGNHRDDEFLFAKMI